jgi:hypothetical protein
VLFYREKDFRRHSPVRCCPSLTASQGMAQGMNLKRVS